MRAIRTHSLTVTGKFQFTVSTCGTYPTRSPDRRCTDPAIGLTVPSSARSSVVLPDPDGPTIPVNCAGADAKVDVGEHGNRPVGAGDAIEPGQLRVVDAAAHCGYVASSGATLRTSTACNAEASPPSAVVIVM